MALKWYIVHVYSGFESKVKSALEEKKIVKKRYGYAYPICWGGFVMVGDPGHDLN